jgi:hypothetical protein
MARIARLAACVADRALAFELGKRYFVPCLILLQKLARTGTRAWKLRPPVKSDARQAPSFRLLARSPTETFTRVRVSPQPGDDADLRWTAVASA